MAKKPVKEAGTALIFATVFFVLTTIAFGVLWYTEMNNSTAKDQAVESAKKDKTASDSVVASAKLDATVTRLYFGAGSEADRTEVSNWGEKEKKQAGESLKKITQQVIDTVGKGDASKLPAEITFWKTTDAGLPDTLPTDSPLAKIGDIVASRETAKGEQEKAVALFETAAAALKKQDDAAKKAVTDLETLSKSLAADHDTKLKAEFEKIAARLKSFTNAEATSRAEITDLNNKNSQLGFEKKADERKIQDKDQQIRDLLVRLQANRSEDAFLNDDPHGRITKRLPEGIVEINIGSDALVRPGLTFTVLPQDFPEKGRQSRTFTMREKDERGEYKSVQRFIEKANIEVIEVLGPKLSRARITKEYDNIRDAAGPGDLIYNAAWRKGAADHIALIGVFDANGDGSDDIESVIRDLTRMGIPVDAYFDMRTRKWVGEITQNTRFVVEGWYPVQGALDPNRDEKTKLIGEMTNAVETARKLGVSPIKFQDFFPRLGYRMKIDTTADKINQAVAPYLNKVSTEVLPKGGN